MKRKIENDYYKDILINIIKNIEKIPLFIRSSRKMKQYNNDGSIIYPIKTIIYEEETYNLTKKYLDYIYKEINNNKEDITIQDYFILLYYNRKEISINKDYNIYEEDLDDVYELEINYYINILRNGNRTKKITLNNKSPLVRLCKIGNLKHNNN